MKWAPTPGLRLLFYGLSKLTILVTAIVIVLLRLCSHFTVTVPLWFLIIVSTLSLPFYLISHYMWTEIRNRREAMRMGAVLVPRVKGKWWMGNLDVMNECVRHFQNGYIGECVSCSCYRSGN